LLKPGWNNRDGIFNLFALNNYTENRQNIQNNNMKDMHYKTKHNDPQETIKNKRSSFFLLLHVGLLGYRSGWWNQCESQETSYIQKQMLLPLVACRASRLQVRLMTFFLLLHVGLLGYRSGWWNQCESQETSYIQKQMLRVWSIQDK
jgi:hypothetical protein